MRVGVYWNLKRGGYSLCLLKSDSTRGTVIAHCRAVAVASAAMVVKEGGRLRSVAKFKEVHAWIAGDLLSFDGETTEAGSALGLSPSTVAPCDGDRFRYNPHVAATFFLDDAARSPITHADRVSAVEVDGKPVLTATR